MTKQEQLTIIYRHTHRDYKGKVNGERAILINENGATVLCPLSALTDKQIARTFPYCYRRELQSIGRGATK
jgi:hypothetical protein